MKWNNSNIFFSTYSMKKWLVPLPLIWMSFSAKQGLAGISTLPNGDGEIVTQRWPTNCGEGLESICHDNSNSNLEQPCFLLSSEVPFK